MKKTGKKNRIEESELERTNMQLHREIDQVMRQAE